MMITYIIPIWQSFFNGGIFNYVLRYFIALAFLAVVPILIRELVKK